MISISGYTLQEKMRHNHNIDTYYALRLQDKCKVLLKIPDKLHYGSENIAILQHEYQLLNMLEVPTIIKAYDFLQNTESPVLILEDVKGQLLTSYLLNHQLEIGDFFNLALQLVDILGELHQRNIIHKEIKPSNIVIDPENMILKLVDLSISTKLTEETFDYLKLYQFDEGLAYISPEQTGRINRPIDFRTDFYSLGITFYEMLANQLPFQTVDTLELVHCHIAKKPPTVLKKRPNVPKMLGAIIEKLLAKMPEERYSSIIGLKYDLQKSWKLWQSKKTQNEFVLGAHDIHDHLSISRKLYGREHEIYQLLKTFNSIRHGSKEMLMIAGYSGIGKTSLVKEAYKLIAQHRGYYIQGKFDQLKRSIPYSAIVNAFKNLVKQVLSQSEERLEQTKKLLLSSLGNVGQVVIDVIPEVELIIGKQPPVLNLSPGEAQIRFNLVFQNFVRVFAQAEHPLVMFLDDLQWADNSSLHFIENLLLDRDANYLLIIGAYRDNEITTNHPLQLSINSLKKNKIPLNTLVLKPLCLNNIQDLLYDTLSNEPKKCQELAQSIFSKTQGNPFFINEFLKMIHEQKLLNFSYKRGTWEWDLSKIKQQSATDNVIDLLTAKIYLLPNSSQTLLKLGSCFGHQFDFKALQIISGQTTSQIAEYLWQAIKANLIYPLEESYKTRGLVGLDAMTGLNINALHYNFAHDRIQQAVYGLIGEQERLEIHLKIGRLLLKDNPLTEQDFHIFDVLKHFNQSISLIDDPDERLQLAQYNFWAGKRAKQASAYDVAMKHLSSGIKLLKPLNWEKNYDLAFQLYKELATCNYLVSDFKVADKYFSMLIKYAQNNLDKIGIVRLKIEMLSTLGKHNEALDLGLKILKEFGIYIPKKPNLMHVLYAILKIKFQLKTLQVDNTNLSLANVPKQRAIIDLFTQVLNNAFFINQSLFVFLTCKKMSVCIKHGFTDSLCMSLPVYAFILMHGMNRYNDAISLVRLYEHLKQRYEETKLEGRLQFILGSLIQPYQISMNLCNDRLINAFRLCCESGDLVYSNYSSLLMTNHSLTTGKTLDEVKKNVHMTLSFMSRAKISDFLTLANFYDYYIQCMEKPVLAMTQVTVFEEKIMGETNTDISFFYSTLTIFHFILGNISEAIRAGQNHELYSEFNKGFFCHFNGKFFYALALLQSLSTMSHSEQRASFKKIRTINRYIQQCAVWCPTNFKTHALLLAAEIARLSPSYKRNPILLYEQSIEAALSSGFILLAAIGSERAGSFCLATNMERMATTYLQNAHQYFKDWGANTKVALLESSYQSVSWASDQQPLLVESKNQTRSIATKDQTIDMLAILKFTQLLSSEIRLDKFLKKFLVIVLENAGAQRGILFAQVNNQWVVEAEGDSDHQMIYLNQLVKEKRDSTYPVSLLNFVQRTQKPIILNDASRSDLTSQDEYVQQKNLRSLLMMPLFYKGQLSRMLYLENSSSSYTFTPGHLDSLQLLAFQAMVSLENAKLYYQATHDPLTGLANRNLLYETFIQMTKVLSKSQKKLALLFLDIDYFKVINDTLGHDIGDKLLIHLTKTIMSCIGESDIAARIGGDEFIIILSNTVSKNQITAFAEQLMVAISRPISIGEHSIQISSSMGISVFPNDGKNIQELLKLADTALYQAKEKGRNQFNYYSAELYEEYQQKHHFSQELQYAYDQEEFFLMYQPIYNNFTGEIMGLEALLRWNHPHKGVLEATKFIDILEKSALMMTVSDWVINKVCRQAKMWNEQKLLNGPIAINISAKQFIHHSLSNIIADALTKNQLDSSCIELEITETVIIENNDTVYREIDKLQKMGINLVIDDFGIGYSNLSYLKHLPVKKVKIDKEFIKHCHDNPLDQSIIKAIVSIVHQLDIQVVAEGIENKEQLQLLQAEGVDLIQGYYYSTPLTAEACGRLLKKISNENNKQS